MNQKYIILSNGLILDRKSFYITSVKQKYYIEIKKIFFKIIKKYHFEFGDNKKSYCIANADFQSVLKDWHTIMAASEIAGQIEEIENNNTILNKIIAIIEQKDLNEIKEFCRRNGFDHPLLDFASKDDIIEKIKEQNEDVITKIYNTINA